MKIIWNLRGGRGQGVLFSQRTLRLFYSGHLNLCTLTYDFNYPQWHWVMSGGSYLEFWTHSIYVRNIYCMYSTPILWSVYSPPNFCQPSTYSLQYVRKEMAPSWKINPPKSLHTLNISALAKSRHFVAITQYDGVPARSGPSYIFKKSFRIA